MPESKYTQALADEICAQLESGLSLNAICKSEDMPPESTVRLWALDDREGFAAKYARAREIGYLRLADEIIDIADDGRHDYRDVDGNKIVDHDHIARARLRVDSRKWMLSKVLPKIYGDKMDVNATIDGNVTFTTVYEQPPAK